LQHVFFVVPPRLVVFFSASYLSDTPIQLFSPSFFSTAFSFRTSPPVFPDLTPFLPQFFLFTTKSFGFAFPFPALSRAPPSPCSSGSPPPGQLDGFQFVLLFLAFEKLPFPSCRAFPSHQVPVEIFFFSRNNRFEFPPSTSRFKFPFYPNAVPAIFFFFFFFFFPPGRFSPFVGRFFFLLGGFVKHPPPPQLPFFCFICAATPL